MLATPYTIIIDTAEQLPFPFTGLYTDADHGNELWDVKTVLGCLGRHPDSWGDYSIIGHERRVAVERKSVADLQSTVLGWDGHRDRFENELANLSQCEAAAVIVEGTFGDVITSARQWGKKTKAQNAKILDRSILSYMAKYNVAWVFSGSREMAQYHCFHWLRQYWEHDFEEKRRATREKEREQRRLANADKLLKTRLFRNV